MVCVWRRTIVVAGLALVGSLGTVGCTQQQSQSCDVLVYGGTPAGITAAVAAARQKVSVTLIEPSRHLGGMTTGGLSATDVGRADLIGGLALEFFERAAKAYQGSDQAKVADKWYSEPHVAERVFNEMLREAGVRVVVGERLSLKDGVKKDGARIVWLTMESGKTFAAKVFVDASYEGDVMAKSGVSYIVGRESRATYDEPLAGYTPMPIRPRTAEVMGSEDPCVGGTGPHYIHGTPTNISALDANGKPIFGVEPAPTNEKPGDADDRTQSYNFRVIVTRDPANCAPFPKPTNYDPSHYELLVRLARAYPNVRFARLFHLGTIPNGKYDLNAQGLLSTDFPGANTAYPDGDYATRRRIWQEHTDYIQGLLWCVANDQRLPKSLRDEAGRWGLAKDEFPDNGHWPYALYVREGRRMIGPYVLKQRDVQQDVSKPDAVAMGNFVIDSHIVRRIVTTDGNVIDEGSFIDAPTKPYHIPYRCITPRRQQCTNLLVPVCISASHIGYCTIRMEPQYMMMGHAAGLAATMALSGDGAVQDVDVPLLQAKLREQRAVLARPGRESVDLSKLPGVVVDDEDATFAGDWVTSSFGDPIGGSSRHDGNAGKGLKSARFELKVPTAGQYEVRLAYVASSNRATNVPVNIEHANGTTSVRVNQRQSPAIGGHFVSLGTFTFSPQHPAVVTIRNDGTDGYVVADAVQLLPAP